MIGNADIVKLVEELESSQEMHTLSILMLVAGLIAFGFLVGRVFTVTGYRKLEAKNREHTELIQKDIEIREKEMGRQNSALERIASAIESLRPADTGRTPPQP